MSDEGGDPACWADRVCPACGRLDERRGEAGTGDDRCPHCGAPGRGAPDDDTPDRRGPDRGRPGSP